jgi:hypothetical protein
MAEVNIRIRAEDTQAAEAEIARLGRTLELIGMRGDIASSGLAALTGQLNKALDQMPALADAAKTWSAELQQVDESTNVFTRTWHQLQATLAEAKFGAQLETATRATHNFGNALKVAFTDRPDAGRNINAIADQLSVVGAEFHAGTLTARQFTNDVEKVSSSLDGMADSLRQFSLLGKFGGEISDVRDALDDMLLPSLKRAVDGLDEMARQLIEMPGRSTVKESFVEGLDLVAEEVYDVQEGLEGLWEVLHEGGIDDFNEWIEDAISGLNKLAGELEFGRLEVPLFTDTLHNIQDTLLGIRPSVDEFGKSIAQHVDEATASVVDFDTQLAALNTGANKLRPSVEDLTDAAENFKEIMMDPDMLDMGMFGQAFDLDPIDEAIKGVHGFTVQMGGLNSAFFESEMSFDGLKKALETVLNELAGGRVGIERLTDDLNALAETGKKAGEVGIGLFADSLDRITFHLSDAQEWLEDIVGEVQHYSREMLRAGNISGDAFHGLTEHLHGLEEQVDNLAMATEEGFFSPAMAASIDKVGTELSSLQTLLAGSNNPQQMVLLLAQAFDDLGDSLGQFDLLDEFNNELTEAVTSLEMGADLTDAAAGSLDHFSTILKDAALAARLNTIEMDALGDVAHRAGEALEVALGELEHSSDIFRTHGFEDFSSVIEKAIPTLEHFGNEIRANKFHATGMKESLDIISEALRDLLDMLKLFDAMVEFTGEVEDAGGATESASRKVAAMTSSLALLHGQLTKTQFEAATQALLFYAESLGYTKTQVQGITESLERMTAVTEEMGNQIVVSSTGFEVAEKESHGFRTALILLGGILIEHFILEKLLEGTMTKTIRVLRRMPTHLGAFGEKLGTVIERLPDFTQALAYVGAGMKAFIVTIKSILIPVLIALATVLIGKVVFAFGKWLDKMAVGGAKIAQLTQTFNQLASSIGTTGTEMRESMGDATKGMVANSALMQQAVFAINTGVAESEEQFGALAQQATLLALATGKDATEAIDRMTRAIALNSLPNLKWLNLVVDTEEAHRDYARTVNKSVDDLTEHEKIQARTVAVLAAARKTTRGLAIDTESLQAAELKQQAATKNLGDTFKTSVAKSEGWLDFKIQLLNLTTQLTETLIEMGPVLTMTADLFGKLASAALSSVEALLTGQNMLTITSQRSAAHVRENREEILAQADAYEAMGQSGLAAYKRFQVVSFDAGVALRGMTDDVGHWIANLFTAREAIAATDQVQRGLTRSVEQFGNILDARTGTAITRHIDRMNDLERAQLGLMERLGFDPRTAARHVETNPFLAADPQRLAKIPEHVRRFALEVELYGENASRAAKEVLGWWDLHRSLNNELDLMVENMEEVKIEAEKLGLIMPEIVPPEIPDASLFSPETLQHLANEIIKVSGFLVTQQQIMDGWNLSAEHAAEVLAVITERFGEVQLAASRADQAFQRIGDALQSTITEAITDFAGALGETLAGIGEGFDQFGRRMLGLLGNLLKNVGRILIAFGVAGIAIKAFMANPALAIAAGAALVALGSALSAAAGGAVSAGGAAIARGGSGGTVSIPPPTGTLAETIEARPVILQIVARDLDRAGALRILEEINANASFDSPVRIDSQLVYMGRSRGGN